MSGLIGICVVQMQVRRTLIWLTSCCEVLQFEHAHAQNMHKFCVQSLFEIDCFATIGHWMKNWARIKFKMCVKSEIKC